MNETTGVLRPVVEKYLQGGTLDAGEVATMRAYLRQWVAGRFIGTAALRVALDDVQTDADVRKWLAEALDVGIDPL